MIYHLFCLYWKYALLHYPSHTINCLCSSKPSVIRTIFAISLICFTKDTSSRRSLIVSPSQRSPRRRNCSKQRESRASLFASPDLVVVPIGSSGVQIIVFKYLFIESKNTSIEIAIDHTSRAFVFLLHSRGRSDTSTFLVRPTSFSNTPLGARRRKFRSKKSSNAPSLQQSLNTSDTNLIYS